MNAGGFLRFPKTLQEDSGKYTCLVDVSVDGKTYTAARSTQVNVKEGTTLTGFDAYLKFGIDGVSEYLNSFELVKN